MLSEKLVSRSLKAGVSTALAVSLVSAASVVSAQTIPGGDDIVSGIGELSVIAGSVVTALIAFGVTWYLGKKVYMMTKA